MPTDLARAQLMGTRGFRVLLVALLTAACAAAQPATAPASSTPAASTATTAELSPTVTPVLATPTSAPATASSVPTASTTPLPTSTPGPATPKAVIIVGPTDELTDGLLADGESMAQRAEAAGMDVRRVFFPHATWDNVVANVQGASLVAYFGHGYGWPSNTAELTESRQDGMGLNTYDGSGAGEVKYYGANKIRQYIRLAPHAAVFVLHGCYTAGNGLSSAPVPTVDVARQRVDNYASGWLAAGAGVVYAFAYGTRFNYPDAWANSDATADELFTSPREHVGWNDLYFASLRTPGAVNHLDPSPKLGYLRAVTGDLTMTTATWRSGAGQVVAF